MSKKSQELVVEDTPYEEDSHQQSEQTIFMLSEIGWKIVLL